MTFDDRLERVEAAVAALQKWAETIETVLERHQQVMRNQAELIRAAHELLARLRGPQPPLHTGN